MKRHFYKVKLSNGAEWFDDDSDCLFERIAAERILEMCKGQPATVKSIISQSKRRTALCFLAHLFADSRKR